MTMENNLSLTESLCNEKNINKWRCQIDNLVKLNPNNVQNVKLILDRFPHSEKIFKITIPWQKNQNEREFVLRYLGAWVNNAIMTWGCRNAFISKEVYSILYEVIEKHYSQALKTLKENSYLNSDIKPIENFKRKYIPKKPSQVLPTKYQLSVMPIVGIDIGNTTIKLVVIKDGKTIYKERVKTFKGNIKSLKNLITSFEEIFNKAKNQFKTFSAIGIGWFGDVRDGKPLMQAHDLEQIEGRNGKVDVDVWINSFMLKSNAPVVLLGDSEALGKSLPLLWKVPNLYLLIFGTSVGSAYTNEHMEFENQFGLISRVVIDMSKNAPPHSATKVKGAMQQYVASRGILRAIKFYFSNASNPISLPINEINKESSGLFLQKWLESKNDCYREFGMKIINYLSERISEGIVAISDFYEIKTLGLTGTSLQGAVGPAIVEMVQLYLNRSKKGDNIKVEIAPFDLTFGGAIGAAYSAALKLHLKKEN